jgi:methylated-DNA-[protein]-cysteine S-methyltransferase
MTNTLFTESVRDIVRNIPAGTVMSYKEVAEAVGRPLAHRAVASIMANNYDPTVPCHRVIRSDGSLGGYNRGGEAKKRKLLIIEGAILE